MQHYTVKKGTTSVILPVSIYNSSSTTGAKLTGLVFNTASLTAYYNRTGAAGAATAITLVTATKGTYTSSGFIAIDGTNMPGDYELHIPNAALATGADSVLIQLKGAANMVPVNIMVELVDNIEKDTYDIVNHASYGNAQLVRSTTPANTLDVSATGESGLDFNNIKQATGATTLNNITVPVVTTNSDMRGTDNAALASVCTEARLSELDAGTAGKAANQIDIIQTDTTTDIPATLATISGYIDTEISTLITNLATVDTVVDGIQTDLSNGTDGLGALKALIDTLDTVADAIKAKTDSLTFTVANQVDSNAQSINNVTITGDGSATPFDV